MCSLALQGNDEKFNVFFDKNDIVNVVDRWASGDNYIAEFMNWFFFNSSNDNVRVTGNSGRLTLSVPTDDVRQIREIFIYTIRSQERIPYAKLLQISEEIESRHFH